MGHASAYNLNWFDKPKAHVSEDAITKRNTNHKWEFTGLVVVHHFTRACYLPLPNNRGSHCSPIGALTATLLKLTARGEKRGGAFLRKRTAAYFQFGHRAHQVFPGVPGTGHCSSPNSVGQCLAYIGVGRAGAASGGWICRLRFNWTRSVGGGKCSGGYPRMVYFSGTNFRLKHGGLCPFCYVR